MKPALLLVDLQGDYLSSVGLLPGAEIVVTGAAKLLAECRRRRIPIVHIWTTVSRKNDTRLLHWKESKRWLCEEGTDGHRTPACSCNRSPAKRSRTNPDTTPF